MQVEAEAADGVARFEEARALNEDDRPLAAHDEAGGDRHGLALAADGDERDRALQDGLVEEACLAVREPDDVRDAAPTQLVEDAGGLQGRRGRGHMLRSSLPRLIRR